MITKFRAWLKDDNEMIDVMQIAFDTKWIRVFYQLNYRWFKFDDVLLMQSTGLKDKNSKEVFIGDIVKCTRGCPHEVYLEKEYGGTFVGGMPAVYLKGLLSGYAWTGDEEIIGNVYQNPELLEADND